MKNSLSILSQSKCYPIHFIKHQNALFEELSILKNSVIIIDRNIVLLYPDFCTRINSLGATYVMDALEKNKTLAGAEAILHFFQSVNVTRDTTVIAIGGGILQDVASFASHIFNRGLKVILVPTTLLAMCDSSVGGKCGVNFNGYKNQLGAFHPPEKIFILPEFLHSLSDNDIRSGYGEVLKYRLLNSQSQYEKFKQILLKENFLNDYLVNFIYEGLSTKKKFVELDEFDTGARQLLNYGHTFGHAIERATQYIVSHGLAVTKGIDIVNYIAWQLGILKQEVFFEIHSLIKTYFPCSLDSDVTANVLIDNAKKDKKIKNGKWHLVLMEDFGQFQVMPLDVDEKMMVMINNYLRMN